jgi:hypothetical protein
MRKKKPPLIILSEGLHDFLEANKAKKKSMGIKRAGRMAVLDPWLCSVAYLGLGGKPCPYSLEAETSPKIPTFQCPFCS